MARYDNWTTWALVGFLALVAFVWLLYLTVYP
jgi:hypothetical protein